MAWCLHGTKPLIYIYIYSLGTQGIEITELPNCVHDTRNPTYRFPFNWKSISVKGELDNFPFSVQILLAHISTAMNTHGCPAIHKLTGVILPHSARAKLNLRPSNREDLYNNERFMVIYGNIHKLIAVIFGYKLIVWIVLSSFTTGDLKTLTKGTLLLLLSFNIIICTKITIMIYWTFKLGDGCNFTKHNWPYINSSPNASHRHDPVDGHLGSWMKSVEFWWKFYWIMFQ